MNRFLKKNYLKTLCLSYVSILLFALLIGVVLFHSSLERIEENAVQFNRTSLLQVTDSIERLESDLLGMTRGICARTEYLSLIYADEDLTSYKLERVADLQSELWRQVAYSSYVSNIFLWFDGPQIAATTSGFCRTEASFDGMLRRELGVTLEEVSLWGEAYNGITLYPFGTNGPFANQLLAITYGTPDIRGERPLILMKLRIDTFQKLLLGDESDSLTGTMFWAISERNGQIIAPHAVQDLAAFLKEEDLQADTVTRFTFEGRELALMSLDPPGDGFTVVSACEFSAYAETQQQYTTIALIFLGVYLALGFVIAAFLIRQNYRPIQRLSHLILNQVSTRMDSHEDSSKGGDLLMLEASINTLLRYSQDYEHQKVLEEKKQREAVLLSLLLGELGDEENFSQICWKHGLNFPSNRFAVAGVAIRDYSDLFFDKKASQEKDAFDVALLAVNSIVGELLDECGGAYLCRHEGRLWAILSPIPLKEEEDFHQAALSACEKSETFLREQLGIRACFYISRLSKTSQPADAIRAAYQQAKWGLEQMESYSIEQPVGDQKIVEAHIRPAASLPPDDAGAKRRQMFKAVTAGDLAEGQRIYQELRQIDLAFSDGSFATVRAQSQVLIGYFVSLLPESVAQKYGEDIQQFVESIRLETKDDRLVAKMHDWMAFYFRIWKETEAEKPKEGGADVAAEAARFIVDHYTDPGLSVSYVAERLSVSVSYLSRMFKKKYDMSVLEYIQRNRIDAAKVLIRESGNTLESIAGMVGYSNSLALIRAFKNREGCTPTEYRKGLLKEE